MAIVRPRTSGFIVDPLLAQQRKEAAAREANLERSLQFLNQAFLQQSAIDYAKEQKELDALAKKAKAEGDAARNRMADDQFMQAPGLTSQQVAQGFRAEEELEKAADARALQEYFGRQQSQAADLMSQRADKMLGLLRPWHRPGSSLTTPCASQISNRLWTTTVPVQCRPSIKTRLMPGLCEIVDEQENVRQINAMLAPLMAASRPSATATQPSVADRMPMLPALQLPGTSGFPAVSGAVDPQVLQLMQTLAGRGIDPRTIARFLDPYQPDASGESAGRVALQQLLRQSAGGR